MSEDWLDISTSVAVVRSRKPPRTVDAEAVARGLRKLTFSQRAYLKALSTHGMIAQRANRALTEAGRKPPGPYTINAWNKDPNYILMKQFFAELALAAANVDKTPILLRAAHMVDYNSEEVDETHQGEPTGRKSMRDASVALRALELLGKKEKLWGDEKTSVGEGPSLVVQIISQGDSKVVVATKPRAIEGECTVVVPEPDDANA